VSMALSHEHLYCPCLYSETLPEVVSRYWIDLESIGPCILTVWFNFSFLLDPGPALDHRIWSLRTQPPGLFSFMSQMEQAAPQMDVGSGTSSHVMQRFSPWSLNPCHPDL
jgi:hypothetical protein